MFKFLKDKIKESVSKISEKFKEQGESVEEEVIEEEQPAEPEEKEETKEEVEEKTEPDEDQSEDTEEETIQDEKDEDTEVDEETTDYIDEKEEVIEEEPEEKDEETVPDETETEKVEEVLEKEETEEQPAEEIKETPEEEPKEEIVEEKEEEVPDIAEEDTVSKDDDYDEIEVLPDEEEPVLEKPEEDLEEIKHEEKKGFFSKIKEKFTSHEEKEEDVEKQESISEKEDEETIEETFEEEPKIEEQKVEEVKETQKEETVPEEKVKEEEPEKKGFFGKIKDKVTLTKISEKQFEDIFWDLEIVLMENSVAVEVVEKIKEDLRKNLVDNPISRKDIEKTVVNTLKGSINELLSVEKVNIFEKFKEKKPYVVCFVGINGSGKTTTIAKFTNLLKKNGLKVVLAAADTFRAASIEQLEMHGKNLGVKVIKHDYKSDPAAVAFDAIKHAKSKDIDVVLIDTAGRMHSNANLLEEMRKIIRVANPDLKIFVGESITGNDCVEQAKEFNEAVGLDGIILSKADIDEKGGAAISVSYITKKPILYIGTGQEYDDLKEFEPSIVLDSLGLED